MLMNRLPEINGFLSIARKPQAFLATLDDNGAPQVRPLTLLPYRDAFYMATFRSSRKAVQIDRDNRVEFVTLFRSGEYNGYLRVMGRAEEVRNAALAETVTSSCSFKVSDYWEGVEDPNFLFLRIRPSRVEYMKPGEDKAVDVTNEFK